MRRTRIALIVGIVTVILLTLAGSPPPTWCYAVAGVVGTALGLWLGNEKAPV